MTTPIAAVTAYQTDIIQTAAAIVSIVDERALASVLRQTAPLSSDQLADVKRRFEDGAARWQRDIKQHHPPDPSALGRIAIVADILSQRHPEGMHHDAPGQVTLFVADLQEAFRELNGDLAHHNEARERWESIIRSLFAHAAGSAPLQQSRQAARNAGMLLARSVGVEGIFNNIFTAGDVPLADVPPLPDYAPGDPRGDDLVLMGRLQIDLSVTEGLLEALTPETPQESHAHHVAEWVQKRANLALEKAQQLVIPSGIAKVSAQLRDTETVLKQSRDRLRRCIYGTEPEVAEAAARHAVERSFGTILFLAICPNIPFLLPTIELRLTITKPLSFVTRSAHEVLGKVPIFGFAFLLLRAAGQVLDNIARYQVQIVQRIVMDSWLENTAKRRQITARYLRSADQRAMNPRRAAIQRVLLALVS